MPIFLPKVIAHCKQKGYDIILVNDGSTDRTLEIASNLLFPHGYQVISHKINHGYGAAIKSGISAVDTEFLVTIDADGQHRIEDVDRLYEQACKTDADMVVGNRRGQEPSNLY